MKTVQEEWEEFIRDNLVGLSSEEVVRHRATFVCGMSAGLIRCVMHPAEVKTLRDELSSIFAELREQEQSNAPS